MNCVILQPSYFPWRGYFHQIHKADVFVFYDDVQFDRQGWRNRNRILTKQGPAWLTVPVHAKGYRSGLMTLDVRIANDTQPKWQSKHLSMIHHAYSRAPFYSAYAPLIQRELAMPDTRLVDLTIRSTVSIAREMGIAKTQFFRSSELGLGLGLGLGLEGDPTQRLIGIIQAVGADRYISGPSARTYLNEPAFAKAGIELEYMRYEYREYEQMREPFEPQLSVLDLLMMKGPNAGDYIWNNIAERT